MQPTATDVARVCLSVCMSVNVGHTAELCKIS